MRRLQPGSKMGVAEDDDPNPQRANYIALPSSFRFSNFCILDIYIPQQT